ncbi:flagellar hook-basal body complex protein FliE [bacterium]|nr:flagellar hook-basal body complex protein FliE [bacterium]
MDIKIQPFGPEAAKPEERTPKTVDGKSSFGDFLKQSIKEVNSLQNEADKSIVEFSTGKTNDIHQVMMTVQKADLSFRLMSKIRNKLMDAYKEVTRMGV